MQQNQYDVIVIGSGLGSLTVASILAQWQNKRVLILERHFQPGGFTHAFKRKGGKYTWDVGLHYVGGVGEGEPLRKVFDLVTGGKLKWAKMPDPFDLFVYPDFTFHHHFGLVRFMADLIDRFRAEEKAILQYGKDIQAAIEWYKNHEIVKNLPGLLQPLGSLFIPQNDFIRLTTKEYLDKRFKNETLKSLLASQWGDYGLPPGQSAFVMHSLLVMHYMNGAYYPISGPGKIAEYAQAKIEEKSGEILLNHKVKEILIENNRAVGVRVENSRATNQDQKEICFYADTVISGAGSYITFDQLVPEKYADKSRKMVREFVSKNRPTSHISLHIGFKDDPRKLGFKGENHWIFQGYDHDAAFKDLENWQGHGKPAITYLSFQSLKDHHAEKHTAELITFTGYDLFAKWKNQPWRKRDDEYKAIKANMAEGLIKSVDEKYAGFADLIDYQELSTPLTTEYMTGHYKGTIYGLPTVPERYDREKAPWCQAKTEVENLYLTGTDVAGLGIGGALMGGVATASQLVGPANFMRLLAML